MMKDYVSSVLARLKNRSILLNVNYQQCLQLFMQEEFLRRLSKSQFKDFLVLKGGLFIYILTNFESRSTLDVDFLLQNYPNSVANIELMIKKIIDTPTENDFVSFQILKCYEITPQKKYHGTCVQLIGMIRNIRVPFHIDIGVGDIVLPEPVKRSIQTQLPEYESPIIFTYSLESTIAEKFDAILQRFELSSRMKDFYDIYYLSRTYDFEGYKLQLALYETMNYRNTKYDENSLNHLKILSSNNDMLIRWELFLKSIGDERLLFSVVINEIYYFIEPLWECIITETICHNIWNSRVCKWVENI
ncbi:MAG: nucleotidyl transferase AbiEii/AbiGii toxin family protein [Erysipelotrichaceae bacterium]|nr:nucleotidyl transferase AbiEii/AbiGii toxin family protein [Erysipelotrichaceae bacterium]